MVIAAIDAVLGAYSRIDGLVNNAGGQYRAPMKTISTKGFEAVVRSNLTGGFFFFCEGSKPLWGGESRAHPQNFSRISHRWAPYLPLPAVPGGEVDPS